MSDFSRRQFIKIGSASAGAVAFSGLPTHWWGFDGNGVHDPGTEGDKVIPTFCELCFWKCGVLAHVKDGRVTSDARITASMPTIEHCLKAGARVMVFSLQKPS